MEARVIGRSISEFLRGGQLDDTSIARGPALCTQLGSGRERVPAGLAVDRPAARVLKQPSCGQQLNIYTKTV